MFNEELGYDPASPESIESYALQLEDKTFMEIVAAKGHMLTILGCQALLT